MAAVHVIGGEVGDGSRWRRDCKPVVHRPVLPAQATRSEMEIDVRPSLETLVGDELGYVGNGDAQIEQSRRRPVRHPEMRLQGPFPGRQLPCEPKPHHPKLLVGVVAGPSDPVDAVVEPLDDSTLQGTLQCSDAHLRLYGHPDLLGIAAALNGDDFTPFNEGIFIKDPGLGPSVAWHRDGVTHWDSPDWDQGTHGFNMMAQAYGCEPENGVWVVIGSHKQRNVDIAAMAEHAGSDRLPDAVPLVCAPGDVAIVNRQAIHGSFANTSAEPRVTFNLGFHRRASVLGAMGSGIHGVVGELDEARIDKRSEMIGWAIAARRQRYPDETSFDYQPLRDRSFEWNESARAEIRDYSLLDLSI